MRVDALCVVFAPGHTDDEKSSREREDVDGSVFGHTMWLHIAVATNHVFPPQRYEYMTGVGMEGGLVRLLRKNIFMQFPVCIAVLRPLEYPIMAALL